MKKLKTTVEEITPTKAATYLESMGRNRKVKRSVVDRFVRDILAGKWQLTGQPIVFDKNGKLIDGQHRLQACIDAGKPIQLLVVRGVQPKAYEKMDIGSARTVGDILSSAGFANGSQVAAACRVLIGLQRLEGESGNSDLRWAKNISHTEVLQFARSHAEDLEVASDQIRPATHILRPTSLFIALRVRLGWAHKKRAALFFLGLTEGADLNANGPQVKLRNILIRDLTAKTEARKSHLHKSVLTIKAWNAWSSGKEVKNLRFAENEEFPKILERAGR